MKAQTYFRKYGKIYAVSFKNQWLNIDTYTMVFDKYSEYLKWLNKDEGDGRTRKADGGKDKKRK